MDLMDEPRALATKAIHSFHPEDWSWSPVILPIVSATCFKYGENSIPGDFSYVRYGNPTVSCLEKTISALDEAKYGLCFSSGTATFVSLVQLLRPGDHIIYSEALYGGTINYLTNYARNMGMEISSVDCSNLALLDKSVKSNTKYVILEVFSNPTVKVLDIQAISEVLSKYPDTLLVVDNTFLTPVFLKPLLLGADVVVHSLTKYMNGHGDVLMGAALTNNEELYKKLKKVQTDLGSFPSAFDCYLVNRGLKTLKIRMREHMKNAETVAKFLESQDSVEKVRYPGLRSHPDHALAKRQCTGYGGIVAVYLKGGQRAAMHFMNNLKVFTVSGSLGLIESIVSYPWSVSHAFLPEEERRRIEVTDNMVRLSVGLEDEKDLIQDLKNVLRDIPV